MMNAPAELLNDSSTRLAAIDVRTAVDQDGQRWMHYVEQHRATEIGHHWGWRQVLHEVHRLQPHYLIASRHDCIVGILPMAEVKGLLFGHSLVSLPFVASAGPLFDDQAAHDALLESATALADRLRVSHIELRTSSQIAPRWAQQDLYVDFRRELAADHDENLKRIPRKQRAMVRKGIANQLTSSATDARMMHRLYSDNVHRHGTPGQSLRYFETVQRVFGDQCAFLLINSPDGKPLSSVYSIYWHDTVYPLLAGDVVEARDFSANDFKYWELMRLSVERGVRIFNYGRSKRGTGPYDFKKNWGFEPSPLYYEYYLRSLAAVPQNNPLNPKYRLMIQAWRHMPRWFVNEAGPLIVRTLG